MHLKGLVVWNGRRQALLDVLYEQEISMVTIPSSIKTQDLFNERKDELLRIYM